MHPPTPYWEAGCARVFPGDALPPLHVNRAVTHPSPHVHCQADGASIKAPEAPSQVPRGGARAGIGEGGPGECPGNRRPSRAALCRLGLPPAPAGLLGRAFTHHPRPRHLSWLLAGGGGGAPRQVPAPLPAPARRPPTTPPRSLPRPARPRGRTRPPGARTIAASGRRLRGTKAGPPGKAGAPPSAAGPLGRGPLARDQVPSNLSEFGWHRAGLPVGRGRGPEGRRRTDRVRLRRLGRRGSADPLPAGADLAAVTASSQSGGAAPRRGGAAA